MTARPGLSFDVLDHNVHGEDVVAFLADLHRRRGPLTVIWDRHPIHSKSKAVKAWLARHPGVVAEDFPGYVPDLNPDEGVWGWTKYGRLANLAADGQAGIVGSGDGGADCLEMQPRSLEGLHPTDRVAGGLGRCMNGNFIKAGTSSTMVTPFRARTSPRLVRRCSASRMRRRTVR